MPAESAITPLGWEMINSIPPVFRDDPTIRAILHCYAKEWERIDSFITGVIDQLFPQRATELGLPLWEAMLRLTIAPVGYSVEERRGLVITYLRSVGARGSGADWEAALTGMIGSDWTYEEHDPDNTGPGGSPAAYNVRILLPFLPASARYAAAEALIRAITPANLNIIIGYQGGFVLDQSRLDAGTL